MVSIIKEFLSDWIRNLVILLIIISMVDIVMSKGKMKRYVNFVVGLLIIFTIINPFLNLFKINMSLEKEVSNFDYDRFYRESLAEQDMQIRKIYLNNISNEIKKLIEEKTQYVVDNIEIKTSPDKENIFTIEEIFISLKEGEEIQNSKIKVDKITIGNGVTPVYAKSDPEVNKLLQEFLQIEEIKIHVSIFNEGDKHGRVN